MAGRKHPQDLTHKKPWTDYFLEFVMLFLAVFLGFVAENIREDRGRAQKELVYAEAFYEDLTADEQDLQRIIDALAEDVRAADSLGAALVNADTKTPANEIYMALTRVNRSSETNLVLNDRTVVQLRAGGMSTIQRKRVSDSIVGYYKEAETIRFLQDELLTLKRSMRAQFPMLLKATDLDRVTDSANRIVNPSEPLLLRSTDPQVINACLLWVNNIKHLSSGIQARIREFRNMAARTKNLVKAEYGLTTQ